MTAIDIETATADASRFIADGHSSDVIKICRALLQIESENQRLQSRLAKAEKLKEVCEIIANTKCECDSKVRGYQCCYNGCDAQLYAKLALEEYDAQGGGEGNE